MIDLCKRKSNQQVYSDKFGMMQILLSSMLLLKHVLSLEQNREEFKIIILLHGGNGCDLNCAAKWLFEL